MGRCERERGCRELLLATGKVDIDAKDNNGQTPLSCAARKGNDAVIKLLLATGKVSIDLDRVQVVPQYLDANCYL